MELEPLDLDLFGEESPLGEVVHEALGDALAQLQRRSGVLVLVVNHCGGGSGGGGGKVVAADVGPLRIAGGRVVCLLTRFMIPVRPRCSLYILHSNLFERQTPLGSIQRHASAELATCLHERPMPVCFCVI